MFKWLQKKILGSRNERVIKKLRPVVVRINEIEQQYQSLTDEQLKAKTVEFKERLKQGQTIEDIKVEAFAVVKNTCRRLCGQTWKVCGIEQTWNMVPFDVQLIGGLVLHSGKIAEMATGEGKTLVATLPLYLNALSGENVQLVTVNEYLAQRDSEWMGRIFEFLGLTVGYIKNEMYPEEKKEKYACDILYGTASEFGFDYLRDNGMATSPRYQVQRGHFYCIIDEVDSILIDEARTPLIISGAVESSSSHKYDRLKPRIADLVKKQSALCAEYVSEAEKVLKDDIGNEKGAELLYKVGIGFPKNKRFIKLMENARYKRVYEDTHTFMNTDLKKEENQIVKEDLFYVIDERSNQVNLTEKGRDTISRTEDPDEFVVPDLIQFYQSLDEDPDLPEEEKKRKKDKFQREYEERMEKIHNVSQLLKAFSLFEKDVEYVVQENKVIIVDEYTGRLQPGRRFSDGLHQALEAKEGVTIEKETQTLATITIQNYFRMYKKLAGMTGTAETEADEFYQIYKMEVVVIPTNVACVRKDRNDIIYKTKREKYNAIIDEVETCFEKGQPVLLGTVNVDTSEVLSRLMSRRKIPHNVLNAKQHQKEAEIVAMAGQKGKVTIATNMAGRGTDIKLGQGMNELGGLHVIGSERHESRRIDRQLRGRSGRQGDNGASVFYIALEDDLMRLFGSDRIVKVMEKLGMEEGQELESPFLNKAIERAQKKVEERNFSIRKHTLEFDDVMNKQREILYENRNHILNDPSLKDFVLDKIGATIENRVTELLEEIPDEEREKIVLNWFTSTWPMIPPPPSLEGRTKPEQIIPYLQGILNDIYNRKEKFEGEENLRQLEKFVCLETVDRLWREHLRDIDDIREGCYLMAYGQKDPLQEYKKAAFSAFSELMARIDNQISTDVFRMTTVSPESEKNPVAHLNFLHEILESYTQSEKSPQQMATKSTQEGVRRTPYVKPAEKSVGRNDPCPCNSGLKYKKCCGK
ncbi:MAG: preprotein translocase subunit SecA [Candidatus Aureabacteria bacterium]|nr:preprotein translocase subunit SecA [Candidatus Auribacterota bacterium]